MLRSSTLPLALAACLLWAAAASGGHESLSCGNCHVMHMGAGPSQASFEGLWNTHDLSDGLPMFTLYSSPSFDALGTDIGQPDGPSKLCLGCHDGSYAAFASADAGRMTFGTGDLSKSHPISFTYDSTLAARVRSGRLKDPSSTPSGLGDTIETDLLDENSKVQCTSCHEMHMGAQGPSLLRFDYDPQANTTGALCRTCHDL